MDGLKREWGCSEVSKLRTDTYSWTKIVFPKKRFLFL